MGFPSFNRKKGHKFNAVKTELDGIKFDSKLEANCYTALRDSGLGYTLQDTYDIQEGFQDHTKKIRPMTYRADFTIVTANGDFVVDAKGMKTPEFVLKYKLLLFKGTRIICVGSKIKMVQLIQLIQEGKNPFEVQQIIEAKKKKIKKDDTKPKGT